MGIKGRYIRADLDLIRDIQRFWSAGVSRHIAANELGVSFGTVAKFYYRFDWERDHPGDIAELDFLSETQIKELREQALIRETSVTELLKRLFLIIHKDNLFNAILEDEKKINEQQTKRG